MEADNRSNELRRLIIQMSKVAGVGHIGSSLSIADIVEVLFRDVFSEVSGDAPDRDMFVLSKGHAALALYCALHLSGKIDADALRSYCADGSLLGVHPEHQLPGVDVSTGSLGHGLSIGVGLALGARMRRQDGRAFVLLSDAELNEGSTWEGVMFAGHHQLDNLVAIVDDNGQQALGPSEEVINLRPLGEKWSSFGWDVLEVDGHDQEALARAIGDGSSRRKPLVLLARTISGKGVSFMEGKVEWHYLPLDDRQLTQAMEELT